MHLSLAIPVCTSTGEKVAISRRIEDKWRLIGWGSVITGTLLSNK
jgi:translation initiation factor 2 subunit 3